MNIMAAKLNLIWRVCELPLSDMGKLVFLALLVRHHNNGTGRCNATRATLAKERHTDTRTSSRAIAELLSGGWLTRRRTKGASYYGFPHLEWTNPASLTGRRVATFGRMSCQILSSDGTNQA